MPVIPNITGNYTNVQPYDYRVFKINIDYASIVDVISRKMMEPTFEAIVDAGKYLIILR